MPAMPSDAEQCLIAKNLNFNCVVDQITKEESKDHWDQGLWGMWVDSKELQQAIADKLELDTIQRWEQVKGVMENRDLLIRQNDELRQRVRAQDEELRKLKIMLADKTLEEAS